MFGYAKQIAAKARWGYPILIIFLIDVLVVIDTLRLKGDKDPGMEGGFFLFFVLAYRIFIPVPLPVLYLNYIVGFLVIAANRRLIDFHNPYWFALLVVSVILLIFWERLLRVWQFIFRSV